MSNRNILVLTILSIILLLFIEQVLTVSYVVKTISKAILFLGIPFVLFRKKGFSFLNFRKTDRRSLLVSLISGITVMIVILVTFIGLYPFIDIDALLLSLKGIGVTSTVFPFVALYILFGNSLLEEFFFRGLLPSFLTHSRYRLFIPSFFFAIYHVSIFLTWFSLPLLILSVIGLWIGAIIFQLVNNRSMTILPSWTIHMFADVGVLLIGVYVFYIY